MIPAVELIRQQSHGPSDMSETLASVKSAPTTTPKETFVEVTHTLTDGVLLYRPDENSFIA